MTHLLHDHPQIEPLDLELALARIGQHLAREIGGAQGRGGDVLDTAACRGFRRKVPQGQVCVSQDGDQQVVEIVGDASGEHSQAFELLRLADLDIDLLPLPRGLLLLGEVYE